MCFTLRPVDLWCFNDLPVKKKTFIVACSKMKVRLAKYNAYTCMYVASYRSGPFIIEVMYLALESRYLGSLLGGPRLEVFIYRSIPYLLLLQLFSFMVGFHCISS